MTQRGRPRKEGRASVRTNRDYQVRERERERMSLILESENRDGDGPLTLIDHQRAMHLCKDDSVVVGMTTLQMPLEVYRV